MYGSSVPTGFPAGLPGIAATPAAIGWGFTEALWIALLVFTVVTLATTLGRLVPRRQY